MSVGVSTSDYSVIGHREPAVTSQVEVTAFVAAPPEQVWMALRNFDAKSTSGLLKVLHQETHRKLIYSVAGLPKTVKSMIGQIELRPEGTGTQLHWSVRFTTKPTMFARLLRPLVSAGIARALGQAVKNLNRLLATHPHSS